MFCAYMRPRYQVSVYRTIGPLVSRLFLMGSFSYLQVMMTHIRAWMNLKFDQIRPWTTELAALKRLKN